ncbi:MAG: hypothetical protein FJW38_08170 [Acidobacteria bacterium]|nr:hypothetical protein [Acidobacteriota bacterium]
MQLTRIVVFLSACSLFAQQDMGVVTGVITDKSGAAVPGAKVVIVNSATNETRETTTAETGAFTIGPLRIGSYNIAVERQGFKKATWSGINVSAQDRVRADFQLEIGALSESVSVTAEAPVLNAETATLAHVVDEKQIRELPLNGRNFQQLAWMAAGVMPATRSRDRDSGFNAHGQPAIQNNFIIDGIDNNNNVMGMQDRKSQVVVPSLDAVAEFKVQTSNYSAEFGRNSGAVMIVNLKSGANALHGTLFEYIRNDKTDARDMFSYVDRTGDGRADPEVLKQNQYGGTIGGPIVRNKTFFFGSWEARKQRRAQSDFVIVPTAAERNGTFPTSLATILDPASNNQPFPSNTIPRARFDSTALKLIELWPQPNFTGSGTRQNFIRNPPWNNDRDQIDVRIDHDLSQKDKVFGRFSKNRTDNFRGPTFDPPARGATGNERAFDDDDAHSAVFSWTRIQRSNLVNEFRYGFVRQKVDKREVSTEPMAVVNERFGIKGVPAHDRLFGLARLGFGGAIGYEGFGEPGSMPNFKIHQVHQWLNNLSWYRGNHNFKFGVDLRWNRSDIFGGDAAHGNFQFDGQFTRVSLADFQLGLPASFSVSTLLAGQMRFRNYMFFAQDDWKVTQKLTVNIGVRYELTSPWWEKHNNQSKIQIDPGADFNTSIRAGHCGGSWTCRGLVETDTNNWAPRLGFAYQWNPKTVIRAGSGVFYAGQGSLGGNGRMISNFPFSRQVTLQSTPTRAALRLQDGVPANSLGDGRVAPNGLNWSVWANRFPLPTVYQWNLAVQRELRQGWSLTTAYVGSSSNYIMGNYNWNGSSPGPPATEQQRRRIPQWNSVDLTSPYGQGNYHGLDAELNKRFAKGYSFTAAYTWSHSIDNIPEQFGSGGGGLMDFRNIRLNRANSNFDVRHRFVSSGVWDVPLKMRNRIANSVIGGWQLSGLLSLQTGSYFTITMPNARQRLGATGIGNWWPDRLRDPRIANPTTNRWFDTTAFASPRNADGTWRLGNAGRAILASDNPFNVDAGMLKNFALTERFNLQFRWEVFNVSNTPTLGAPEVNFENPDFGKVRSTYSTPRQMQFALRLSF